MVHLLVGGVDDARGTRRFPGCQPAPKRRRSLLQPLTGPEILARGDARQMSDHGIDGLVDLRAMDPRRSPRKPAQRHRQGAEHTCHGQPILLRGLMAQRDQRIGEAVRETNVVGDPSLPLARRTRIRHVSFVPE